MVKSSDKELLEISTLKLMHHIECRNYRGYDPYDALKSPLFKLPVLRKNKQIRFSAQQLVKRFPINLRPVLLVPKGYNPATLGLCLQAYVNSAERFEYMNPANTDLRSKLKFLKEELIRLIPTGFHGACWGYDFDWEARYVTIPAYKPNIVSTGLVASALYSAYNLTGDQEFSDLVKSASQFVLCDLNRTADGNQHMFSYSPFDREQVYNASMKAVRLLSQVYKLTGDESVKNEAKSAAGFVASKQKSDGSWSYSVRQSGNWSDSYHTGYVLDCLDEYCFLCSDESYRETIKKGYDFFKRHFVRSNGMPQLYADNPWPADCTAGAQTILTLNRFGDSDEAIRVALWMIRNMQIAEGGFYYRKYRHFKIKTNFIRWSDAWMFCALTCILAKLK